MFVLLVTYRAPLERIDEIRPRHASYLRMHYAAGTFLVSGRQQPPAGGVIVAADVDRAEIERIIATDPYVTEGAAEYTVLEFRPTMVADRLKEALAGAGVTVTS